MWTGQWAQSCLKEHVSSCSCMASEPAVCCGAQREERKVSQYHFLGSTDSALLIQNNKRLCFIQTHSYAVIILSLVKGERKKNTHPHPLLWLVISCCANYKMINQGNRFFRKEDLSVAHDTNSACCRFSNVSISNMCLMCKKQQVASGILHLSLPYCHH